MTFRGNWLFVNDKFCEMVGYSRQALADTEYSVITHPDDVLQDWELYQKLVEGQLESYTVEKRYIHKNGQAIWTSIYRALQRDQYKKPLYSITVAVDITQRKQAEEALQDSQADLNRAQSIAHIGSWRMDVRQNILTWSAEAYRIFGIPADVPMTYEKFLACVHPDDKNYVDSQWEAALRGEKYDIEHRIIAQGQIKWVREKAELELDKNGELSGGFGAVQDITALKQAEEALRESERFIKSIAEASPHWFYVFDLDSMSLSYANRPIVQDLGYPAQMQNVTTLDAFSAFMPADELPHLNRVIEEWCALPDGSIRDDEYYLSHADGSIRYFAGREIVFSRRPDGTVRQILGLLLDITQRKRAEEALKKLNETLEQRVMERTAELRKSEEQYRAFFNTTVVGTVQVDLNGQFVDVNDTLLPNHRLQPRGTACRCLP